MRDCYVFDIDGTLADCSHRLHYINKEPKDWRAFFAAVAGDKPLPHIVRLAKHLYAYAKVPVVFVSGRSDECRDETLRWLLLHVFIGDGLYMRRAGDHRSDDIIKLELLAELRADGLNPIMAFDDRSRVVAAWRAAGIPRAQVAEGDF